MIIKCNRCGKPINNANKNNAKYILEQKLILLNERDKQETRTLIICPNCVKDKDEIIW